MTRNRFFYCEVKPIRDQLRATIPVTQKIFEAENELIAMLVPIDQTRLYVFMGYKSLTGYCVKFLKISRTQTQRIVTQVRRKKWGLDTAPLPLSTKPRGLQKLKM